MTTVDEKILKLQEDISSLHLEIEKLSKTSEQNSNALIGKLTEGKII